MITGHGDDLYRYNRIVANFSSNTYSNTDNSGLLEHLQSKLPGLLSSYPEPEPYTLQAELASYYGIAPECILVTNGATEAIYLIAHLFAGAKVNITEPAFEEYRSAAELYQSPIAADASIRWLCNPCNPTGVILEETPPPRGGCLIVDRSYEYYSRVDLPPMCLDDQHIYIHSLTKRYRIPGVRLGYIVSSKGVIAQLRQLRQPWSVNALAIEAGLWVAQRGFPKSIERSQLWAATDALVQALQRIDGLRVMPSQTHFMLFTTPIAAGQLKEYLATKHGLLVRDASNFRGLSPYHVRIATQTAAENQLLIDALTKTLG